MPVRRSVILSTLAALALAVPGVLAPLTAAAQSRDGLIVVPLDSGPADGDSEILDLLNAQRFDPERTRGTAVDPASLGEVAVISPLRPIEAEGRPSGSALRFDGESRVVDFALFVPDAGAVRALRISTLSSINLLPERSQFHVTVNDQPVGTGQLGNFTEFGDSDLPVPAGLLVRGLNRVSVRLVQYHRIFCGPEASFALWTDIDLAGSGAVLEGPAPEAGPESFLMGIARSAATGDGIEIRGTRSIGEHRGEWITMITQRLSAALGGDPVPFRFTEHWSVQGQARGGARVTFLPGAESRVSFRTGGDGATVMLIEYVPGQRAIDLPAFDTYLPVLERRAAPRLIDPANPVTFADFGFRPVEVRDRYTLIEQRLRLPDDYVVLTNAKAEILLDYIYAEDLPAGSMLLVHVNGTNIRLLPLRGEGGRLIEQFPVRFEARLLRAGTNTLGFEVMIPGAPADLPCPSWDRPVLAIGDASRLSVPYSPSMFLPDMHFAFSRMNARSIQTSDLSARAFSENDVVTLRAALGGIGAGADPDAGIRLHLMSIDDLGALPLGPYNFSRRAIENVLLSLPEEIPLAEAAPGNPDSLLRLTSPRETSAAFSTGWDWASRAFNAALQWMHPRSGMLLEEWLNRQRGQAVLLQLDPARPDHLWMLRAPGVDVATIAAALVAARTVGEGPRGQVSVLDAEGRWQNWIAPDRQPVLLEPVTPGNLRHVLGNIVSAMPIRYVTVLFFLALLSALVALRLVISTREHDA